KAGGSNPSRRAKTWNRESTTDSRFSLYLQGFAGFYIFETVSRFFSKLQDFTHKLPMKLPMKKYPSM
ncbi:MAG: hypothetical protein UF305_01955, partial [Oscillospiraceae bacterium]|nr:hypothetical protein [Oscillospiraceae bacterium]